jgi:HPt (histidine-containing phosphotransfer) domain-containing protein
MKDIFDRAGFLNHLMGDEEVANEIFPEFLEDVSHKLTAMKEDLVNNDVSSLLRQVHTLKGAAANVCAVAMHKIACQIEVAGHSEGMDKVSSLIPDLERQLEMQK